MNNPTFNHSRKMFNQNIDYAIRLTQYDNMQTNQAIKNTANIQKEIAQLIKSSSLNSGDYFTNFPYTSQVPKTESVVMDEKLHQSVNHKNIYIQEGQKRNVNQQHIFNKQFLNGNRKSDQLQYHQPYFNEIKNVKKVSPSDQFSTKKSNINNKNEATFYSLNFDENHQYCKQQIIELKKQKIELLKKLNEQTQLHNIDLAKLDQMTQKFMMLSVSVEKIKSSAKSNQTPINQVIQASIQNKNQHTMLLKELAAAKNQISYYQSELQKYKINSQLPQYKNAKFQPFYERILDQGEAIRQASINLLQKKQNQEKIKQYQQRIYQLQRQIQAQRQGKQLFLSQINFFRHKFHELQNQNEQLKNYLKESRVHQIV